MSRIGRLAIKVPEGVSVRQEGQRVQVKGPRGAEEHSLPAQITVAVDGGSYGGAHQRIVDPSTHGLTRKLLAKCVTGVSQGSASPWRSSAWDIARSPRATVRS
jgi:large subunit ribosomal protein L6